MSQVITKRHDVPRCSTTELLQCISMSQAIFQQWPEFLMSLQREAEIAHLAIGCTDADLLTRVTPSGRARCVNSPGCSRSCTGVPVCIASVSDKTKAKGADNIISFCLGLSANINLDQFGFDEVFWFLNQNLNHPQLQTVAVEVVRTCSHTHFTGV